MPNLVSTRGRASDRRKSLACNLQGHRARNIAVAVALASTAYAGSVMVASASGPHIQSNVQYVPRVPVVQAVGFAAGPAHTVAGWPSVRVR